MPHPFKHFIVTRFNLKQDIWITDKSGSDVNDELWLENRYKLFTTYCFPSIRLQSCKQFVWLVFFDTDTPPKYRDLNDGLHSKFENFQPVYVPSFKDFESELPHQIQKFTNSETKYIISTRLDNDDALHKDAIDVIQKHFKPIDRAIIDLRNGLALKPGHHCKLSVREGLRSGPFVSLIEQLKEGIQPMTVYDREHLKWIDDAEFIDVDKGYYWLQIIHERNISNDLGQRLTFNKKYLKGYEFIEKVKFSFRYYIFIILKQLRLSGLIKKWDGLKKS